MCSRFELNLSAREVAARFKLRVPPPLPNRAEVRPTDQALVIGPGGEGRLMPWGLKVAWDKRPLINARGETLASRPAFKRLLGARVLVPATAWWEWQTEGKAKTKMRLELAGGGLFALAGLTDGERFTVVTCAPCAAIAHIHDRMPVVLPPEAEGRWLDPSVPFAEVADALAPYAGALEARGDTEPPVQKGLFD